MSADGRTVSSRPIGLTGRRVEYSEFACLEDPARMKWKNPPVKDGDLWIVQYVDPRDGWQKAVPGIPTMVRRDGKWVES